MRYVNAVSRITAVIIAVALVLIIAGCASVVVPAHAAPQSSPTHKVIIRSAGEPADYSLTVSGQIVSGPREQSDRATAHRVNGHVGTGDTVDTITYTGHITAFQANSSTLKATLDGTLIDARLLDANHLQLETRSTGNTSQRPVRYTVTVSTTIVSGEGTEDRDMPTNTTTVSGWLLPGDSDGFYFYGEIVAVSTSRPARVHVNGQSRSVATLRQSAHHQSTHNRSATPTPRPTATPHSTVHTLVIEQQNGSTGYSLVVSGSVRTLTASESSDSIAGNSVTGNVGGLPWQQKSTDSKDVIHYTGELLDFEYDGGTVHVRVDGEQTDPTSLSNTPATTPPSTRTNTPTPDSSPTTAPVTPTEETTVAPTTSPSDSPSSGGPLIPTWFLIGLVVASLVTLRLWGK
jgi:hypothetical protein